MVDEEVMVSFDITYLYTNIPIIDRWNIIKDDGNGNDQFSWKMAISEDKFLDPVNFLILSFINKLVVMQFEYQHRQQQQKFICMLMNKLQYLQHYTY